ncbi:hypothetical protein NLU13_6148 [Sarocladium strictum]|uniref:Nitrate reductase [NADPH] n=1 Tax=Sarocladium strictum TaxID=5046 RepID=A0AA39L6G1_SARSR|nr:hypothetical protein NLU13_6148 [Sarocladium strictum]
MPESSSSIQYVIVYHSRWERRTTCQYIYVFKVCGQLLQRVATLCQSSRFCHWQHCPRLTRMVTKSATSHYVVKKRDHPGSTAQEIHDEPDWGAGHNHRVGFKNSENRIPGYSVEARRRYKALQDREARGELVNFRDLVSGQQDLRLINPNDRWIGARFTLDCTEEWVKYGQKWPANIKAMEKAEAEKKETARDNPALTNEHDGSERDQGREHGDLKMKKEDELSPAETALLRALTHEKQYISTLKANPGNLKSPQTHNRTDISIDEADQFTPDNWLPRSSKLIRLTGKHPLNAEPPLTVLFDAGLITPNELHYVRNHGPVARLVWEYHTVEVDVGSPDGPTQLGMDELKNDFESINIPVFLACDGNRRKELNLIRRTKGFNWGPGGGSCAYWKGALLRDVLLAAGLKEDEAERADGHRRWVNFEGSEDLAEGKYQTCIPLAYALDHRNDVMLAYEMNNLPLPPDHGYPVRVIIPGHVGGRCVKWLKRIWISEKENDSYYHVWDNRVLPSSITDMESPFAKVMFSHPDTACNEQNLNSVIVRPEQGERIYLQDLSGSHQQRGPANDDCAPGEYRIQGFAYDGGGHEVQRVEVTLDDGENWLYCIRRFPEYPIRHGKKFWTWCHWHVDVPVARLIEARSLRVRCFNVFKNSQPKVGAWNVLGMMNNGWYTVRSEMVTTDHEPAADQGPYVLFRHPVEPGTGEGGWMKPSVINQIEAAKREAGTPQKQFTREEIEKHDKEDDCWIVVDGKVYDATSVMAWHPGGKAPIMAHAGRVHQETSDEFWSIHDGYASDKLKECLLGIVTDKVANFIKANADKQASERAKETGTSKVALQKHRWVPTKLVNRRELSEDTRSYTFQLPDNKAILGLATCKHIQVGFHMKDKMIVRSYTPTRPIFPSLDSTPEYLNPSKVGAREDHSDPHDGDGTFELVVKTYFPTADQPGGAMSNILDCIPIGEEVEIRGPTGEIEYQGNGQFLIEGEKKKYSSVSLVLGGSGVTPGFALIGRSVLEHVAGTGTLEISVVDANRSEKDILLRKELDDLVRKSNGKLRVTHVLSSPSNDWKGLKGYVNEQILRQSLFPPGPDTAAFVCGPPAMMQKAVMPALRNWGYKEDVDLFGF